MNDFHVNAESTKKKSYYAPHIKFGGKSMIVEMLNSNGTVEFEIDEVARVIELDNQESEIVLKNGKRITVWAPAWKIRELRKSCV